TALIHSLSLHDALPIYRLRPTDGRHRQRDLQRYWCADHEVAVESGECVAGIKGGRKSVTPAELKRNNRRGGFQTCPYVFVGSPRSEEHTSELQSLAYLV